jgi:hypothetical protein
MDTGARFLFRLFPIRFTRFRLLTTPPQKKAVAIRPKEG